MCRVLVLGNDKRSQQLYKMLGKNGSKSEIDFLEPNLLDANKIYSKDYNTIILPIPTKTIDNILIGYGIEINRIISHWSNAKYIYATANKSIDLSNVVAINLLENENFTLKNAYLTALAAYEIAFEKCKESSKICMVVGNGRIGKYLCGMLKNKGNAIILVTKNYKQCENAKQYNKCIGYNSISKYIDKCDFIFNTAPYNYFSNSELDIYAGKYFELASAPYGFCYDLMHLPKSVIMCPALPGKYYPKEAAKIIYDSILDFI